MASITMSAQEQNGSGGSTIDGAASSAAADADVAALPSNDINKELGQSGVSASTTEVSDGFHSIEYNNVAFFRGNLTGGCSASPLWVSSRSVHFIHAYTFIELFIYIHTYIVTYSKRKDTV